jgi:hypothetical protein
MRVVSVGDKSSGTTEARAIHLEIDDAHVLLDQLRLDDKSLLALVGPDGTIVGDEGISKRLVAAAPLNATATVSDRGRDWEVQALSVRGLEGRGEIARVVMARKLDGVLTLFPNARLVFALAALAALAGAVATAMKARQITGARVV